MMVTANARITVKGRFFLRIRGSISSAVLYFSVASENITDASPCPNDWNIPERHTCTIFILTLVIAHDSLAKFRFVLITRFEIIPLIDQKDAEKFIVDDEEVRSNKKVLTNIPIKDKWPRPRVADSLSLESVQKNKSHCYLSWKWTISHCVDSKGI